MKWPDVERVTDMAFRFFLKPLAFAGGFVAPIALVGAPGMAIAQQVVPSSAALQSCSVNDGVCELDSAAGWFVGHAQDAKIFQFAASAIKPSVTTEERLAADGRTKVVTFKGANGKYLAVQPENNWEVNFVATSPTDAAAQFIPVAGLDNPSFTSFTALTHQDRFLRHEGFKLFAHVNAGTSLFRRDASWRVLNAAAINTESVRSGKTSVQVAEEQAARQQKAAVSRPAVPVANGPFQPVSHGDVHIRTSDGLTFDFQATGDFIGLRSLDDQVVIQARQVADKRNPKVSVNRAAAIKVGSDRVEIYSDPSLTLYVNGKVTPIPTAAMSLPGGGFLLPTRAKGVGGLLIGFAGMELQARILWYANGSMDVEHNRKWGDTKNEGLYGSRDGNPANDLQVRNGPALTLTPENIAKAGESWRVKQTESLFTQPGQNGGAVAKTQPGLADLDPVAREQAIKDCGAAGVSDAYALRTCVYDVAATGDKTFIQSAQAVQDGVKAIPAQERANETREDARAVAAPAPVGSLMTNGQSLNRGDRLTMNGYYLTFQNDSNLCVYAVAGDRWTWCINDVIGNKYQQVQRVSFEKGVLSAYDSSNAKLWSTRAVADPYAKLVLTPTGSLQTQSAAGAVYWTNK